MAESEDVRKLFETSGIDGTIVISHLNESKEYVYNKKRAETRFTIASTFKILNSLIALNEGITNGQNVDFKWDGVKREFPGWNQDHSLTSAYQNSCVWCYQEVAKQIAPETYKKYLDSAGFFLPESFDQTEFWLNGELSVSAKEQIFFLKKLINKKIPASEKSYTALKEIMLIEQTEEYSVFAKTGWGLRPKPEVGWFVGYLTTEKNKWVFAFNMKTKGAKDLPLRKLTTLESFRVLGIIRNL